MIDIAQRQAMAVILPWASRVMTSVTSFITVPPSDLTFFVAPSMSSTPDQHGAPGRVGECAERSIEALGCIVNHMVKCAPRKREAVKRRTGWTTARVVGLVSAPCRAPEAIAAQGIALAGTKQMFYYF
jgi:hypothetical protein